MSLFINRESELKFLRDRYNSKNAEFIVIYGRRRIGKSELVKQLSKGRNAIYFLATRTTKHMHLKKFLTKISAYFNEYPPEIDSWEKCFDYLSKKIQKKTILVIDEFPYLIESNKEIPSLFQLFWDEYLKEKDIILVLLGSSIAMMETEVLGKKSPLFGRRTGQIKLAPFKFKDILKFYPSCHIEKVIGFYSILGNVPLYLLEFDGKKSALENIRDKIISKKELLNEEVDFLLKEELRDPSTYQAILEAIATCSTASDIAQKSHLELHNLDKYLKALLRLELIYKESPVTINKPKSKKVNYFLKDNFLDFWYTFCHPNASLVEENPGYLLNEVIKPNLNAFIGKKFEHVCIEFLWELNRKNCLPFVFTSIGRQWGKFKGDKGKNTYEIDIGAVGKNALLLAECKWKEDADAEKILIELQQKAEYVDYKGDRHYVIFAKSFKKRIQQKNVLLFDLEDMNEIFRASLS